MDYQDAKVEFFEELGTPGGAAKLGLLEKDHRIVAAAPPSAVEAAFITVTLGVSRDPSPRAGPRTHGRGAGHTTHSL